MFVCLRFEDDFGVVYAVAYENLDAVDPVWVGPSRRDEKAAKADAVAYAALHPGCTVNK